MNDIKKFVAQWSRQGYENGETQPFWLSFIRDVLGVSEPEKIIRFEMYVKPPLLVLFKTKKNYLQT